MLRIRNFFTFNILYSNSYYYCIFTIFILLRKAFSFTLFKIIYI